MDRPASNDPARAASAALSRRIAERIRAAGGWLGFDAFMAMALHEPGLGYYAGGAAKFGPGGDFVTAPGLTPLFGRCVAAQLSQWFADHPALPRRVIEFGAGDGTLAADVIAALDEAGTPLAEYAVVELSGELRARQRATIAQRLGEPAAARVRWWDALPERIEGCVVGNELLDAMPVRLFRVAAGRTMERGVALAGATPNGASPADALPDDASGADVPRFAFADRAADPAFAAEVDAVLEAGFSRLVPRWREHVAEPAFDYVSELPQQGPAWVCEVGLRLARGALLLIDYGFPRAELYHPQRRGGTLMAHRRHRAHGDALADPGTQDLTAHVDFSAVARAAESAGLAPAGFTSQARFLLNCGLLEDFARLQAADAGDALRAARRAQAVQVLLSEAEMGELFKAIAFVRGIDPRSIGFARGDRSGRL